MQRCKNVATVILCVVIELNLYNQSKIYFAIPVTTLQKRCNVYLMVRNRAKSQYLFKKKCKNILQKYYRPYFTGANPVKSYYKRKKTF